MNIVAVAAVMCGQVFSLGPRLCAVHSLGVVAAACSLTWTVVYVGPDQPEQLVLDNFIVPVPTVSDFLQLLPLLLLCLGRGLLCYMSKVMSPIPHGKSCLCQMIKMVPSSKRTE